jgi:carbamate kinase
MLIVTALGGNALSRRGEPLEAEVARRNAKLAAEALAAIASGNQLVVTHGNGPQIGLLALQNEAYEQVGAYPLDLLGAETEGMIGYLLEQELGNALLDADVATLLTQTVVDLDDPAFGHPTKPIGPTYHVEAAQWLAKHRGWTIAPDGDAWRRVVPSPLPRDIVELPTIELLLERGIVVVCAGGGGIPVVEDEHGVRHGVEAVVDKDRASGLLAERLAADLLLLLTDVSNVEVHWGTAHARPLRETTVAELRSYSFAEGSMGPKVEAATAFVEHTGRPAVIGSLFEAEAVVRGDAGTWVRPVAEEGGRS